MFHNVLQLIYPLAETLTLQICFYYYYIWAIYLGPTIIIIIFIIIINIVLFLIFQGKV